jgi:hypothetical protein
VRSVQYRTISRSPHNFLFTGHFAQFIVHRTFSHNLPLSATFCRISCIRIHCITSIHRVNLTWGKLILDTMTWSELMPALCEVLANRASWYHDSRRVDTMTWGELIQALRAYARCLPLGRVDAMIGGELIPWRKASWYRIFWGPKSAKLMIRICYFVVINVKR